MNQEYTNEVRNEMNQTKMTEHAAGARPLLECFCDRCGRHCPLSAPACPRGMEKAGYSQKEIDAMRKEGGQHAENRHEDAGEASGHDTHERRHKGGDHEHRDRNHERRGEDHEPNGRGREHKNRECRGGKHRKFGMHNEPFSAWLQNASEEERLLFTLRKCADHRKHAPEKRSGQRHLLSLLEASGGTAAQSELAQQLNVRRASISEILQKMEDSGLITRLRSEEDRRQLTVSLTKDGQEALNSNATHHREDANDLLQALTKEERLQLQTLLDKLLESWK